MAKNRIIADYVVYSANIADGAITSAKISPGAVGPKISNIQYTSNAWTVKDDTAVSLDGGYFIINGTGFVSGATVTIDTSAAPSVSFVSDTVLRVEVGSSSAGTKMLYVVNPDGGTAIGLNLLNYGEAPSWNTTSPLDNVSNATFFAVTLNATSDSNVSYAVSSGSNLPSGVTLESNGYLSGTVEVASETTYNFSIDAIDEELQDTPKAFSVTVTVIPNYPLYSWGQNTNGQLGLGDISDKSSPTIVGSPEPWRTVAAYNGSYFTKEDGTLWVTGFNAEGSLGLNDVIYRSSPTQVGSLTNWSFIKPNSSSCLAIKTDGTLWSWGGGSWGQLGLNSTVSVSSPTQVGTLNNWSHVAAATFYGPNVLAVKTDGTLWGFGRNENAQLGIGSEGPAFSSPIQIGSDTNWSYVDVGSFNAAAVKTTGTLWTWGIGSHGANGLNDRISRSTPQQVGSSTDWLLTSVTTYGGSALKNNGTIWGWGLNSSGQLGLNDTTNRSSPTQIGTDTNWSRIVLKGTSMVSIKTDNTIWAWGTAGNGQLGLGDTTSKLSPTQIGVDTNWITITLSGSGTHVLGLKSE